MVKLNDNDSNPSPKRGLQAGSLWIVGLFSAALLATWVMPGDAAGAQNRELVAFPAVTTSTFADAATYRGFDAAFRDRIGAQVGVALAVGDLSVHVIGRSPIPRVVLGADRQPFLADDFLLPCGETEDTVKVIRQDFIDGAAELAAAGKYALFVVGPDKSSIRRDIVERISPDLLRCSDFMRAHFESWASDGSTPLLALWDRVSAIDRATSDAYFTNDTHWNARGASALTAALLERLVADGQAPAALLEGRGELVYGTPHVAVTDMNQLMGLTDLDEIRQGSFARPGVVTVGHDTEQTPGVERLHYTSTSDGAALVPGKTLLVGDSFLMTQMPTQLQNYFEDVTFASLSEASHASEFDRIVVVRVQREAGTGDWPVVTLNPQ